MEPVDYFSNHRLKLRFPWRLYHSPIVRELRHALAAVPEREVLNLGSGPFFELSELQNHDKLFTLCDIDQRALDLASQMHGPSLARVDCVAPCARLPYDDASFDAVVSMDVIEHIIDPLPWLEDLVRVLRPGGTLFLTTPNYASVSLRAIEGTALELVARAQGFSRRGLHPTKLDTRKFANLLKQVDVERVRIKSISFGWVLAVYALRRTAKPKC